MGRRVGSGVAVIEGSGRDVVATGGSCDAPVDTACGGIALDASAVGPANVGAVSKSELAAWGCGRPHAESARSKTIAPAQSRRHMPLSMAPSATVYPARLKREEGTPKRSRALQRDALCQSG